MKRHYFEQIEMMSEGSQRELSEVTDQLAFNDRGLIPVITQDAVSKCVMMLAWMNKESLMHTLLTKQMTYWSRSRNELWVKGETSGCIQSLVNMSFDCDGDAILCEVEQTKAACHTGRYHCFYLNVDVDRQKVIVT